MPEESDGRSTVCASLEGDAGCTHVPDRGRGRARHRITFDATELLTLHVTRCLDEEVALASTKLSRYRDGGEQRPRRPDKGGRELEDANVAHASDTRSTSNASIRS